MKNKVKVKKANSISKIDQIVPYENEEDYIKDYDGDYGLDEVRFRFEFEMSPDGKHILRPVYEVHPDEINTTHELLVREAKLLGKTFGYSDEQIKTLFKELYRIVFLWYFVANYPLSDLRKLVKTGYFKHPSDVEDFIILVDDFVYADEIQNYVPYEENNKETIHLEDEYNEEEEDLDESSLDCADSQDQYLLNHYDVEKEYEIYQRIAEINKQKAKEKDPEKIKTLEEEKKALVAKIYRMREEFLQENGLTYDEFILARRALQIEKNWGWMKYPLYDEEEEERDNKWEMIKNILFEKARNLEVAIEEARINGNREELKTLIEKRKKLLSSARKIEFKQMTNEEKKVAKIHSIIDKIYRYGKNKNIEAYKLSETAKSLIKSLKSKAMKKALYKLLDETWKKRKERLAKILTNETKSGLKQVSLFNLI